MTNQMTLAALKEEQADRKEAFKKVKYTTKNLKEQITLFSAMMRNLEKANNAGTLTQSQIDHAHDASGTIYMYATGLTNRMYDHSTKGQTHK